MKRIKLPHYFRYGKHLIVMILVVLTVPFSNMLMDKTYIANLNSDINIDGIRFLTPIKKNLQEQDPKYKESQGYGGRFFTTDDEQLQIVYRGYPDVLDDYKLTFVRIESGGYSVHGIKVGTKIKHVLMTMGKLDYDDVSEGSNFTFSKGDIRIVFIKDYEDAVKSILVEIISSNKKMWCSNSIKLVNWRGK